jgi:hypothetical protein
MSLNRASRRKAASEQRRAPIRHTETAHEQCQVHNRILDEAEAAGGGIDNGGALKTRITRTDEGVIWLSQRAREEIDAGDLTAIKRLNYVNAALLTATGTGCVCCGHVFTEDSPPAAISVTHAAVDDPSGMFAMRICDSCVGDCGENELLVQIGNVIAREIYPKTELISMGLR